MGAGEVAADDEAPSLVDAEGYFRPTTPGFVGAGPKPEEVERELRAQIETAKRHLGKQVSHVSAHMGSATANPELRAITERLAKEFDLKLAAPSSAGRWSGNTLSAEQKEQAPSSFWKACGPGTWMIVEHPGLDTPEIRNIGHRGYENVADDRLGVTRAFTSEQVKRIIADRKIKLISYADLTTDKPRP